MQSIENNELWPFTSNPSGDILTMCTHTRPPFSVPQDHFSFVQTDVGLTSKGSDRVAMDFLAPRESL
jgi:hypothetical protein